ncbi:MAG: hypothetical protein HZC37_15820 [Burkholderiales bacterium]|nr:hypothetical protein [Burkholderiales bacterium]
MNESGNNNNAAARQEPRQQRRSTTPPTRAEAPMQAGARRWRIAFGALAAAVIAAGCGGGGDDPPATASAAIAPRTCGLTNGPATGGLDLSGPASFNGLSTSAGASGTVLFDPGDVTYFNPALPSTAVSGSLRVSLWATSGSYTGGTLTGQVVARAPLVFAGGSNQLGNGVKVDIPAATLSATSPSRGSYCMVITLEQFDSLNCTSGDRYCIVDWAQFAASSEFQ